MLNLRFIFVIVLVLTTVLCCCCSMASPDLPPRKCLTCASSGAECDGGFPVCSSCHAGKVPCMKPQVEVQLPWHTEPGPQDGQSSSQHSITDDAETFTGDFIRAEHKDVIDGITKVYQTLKLMDYIDDAELIYPPHQHLPVQELASLGLEPEAIALLRYLPYLDIEDEISPYTKPYNYLHDIEEARDVLWERKNDLAPWVIRLSYCPPTASDWGRAIIYDVRTKKITQWPNNTPSYANTYLDFPWLSPMELFDEWLNFLRELKEMPWRSRSWRSVVSEYPAPPFNWIDLVANGMASEPPMEPPTEPLDQYSRDCYNFERARKHLFIIHGWPDDFHANEFKEAKRVWQEEQRRLENSKKQATQADAKQRASDEYSKFLEDTAGPGAFKKP